MIALACELEATKTCTVCGHSKHLDGFSLNKSNRKDGRSSLCKPCASDRTKEWQKNNKERVNQKNKDWYQKNHAYAREQSKKHRLKSRFGLTPADFDRMNEECEHKCGICGKTDEEQGKRLSVDHDHKTGAVRALLCSNCNSALGLMREDPEILRKAASYIEKHNKTGGGTT